MIEAWDDMTLHERRDALWGLRDGSATHMNRVRREGFEALKHLILERDLPKSVTHPPAPSNVIEMVFYGDLQFYDGTGRGML
jgi:hypothetical protein